MSAASAKACAFISASNIALASASVTIPSAYALASVSANSARASEAAICAASEAVTTPSA